MLTVSDELKNAFMQSERTIYVRIKIGNRTFDNDNVVSVEYDSGSLSGEVFAIGSTYSNSIKITFSELVEGLKELDEVSYEIGIKLLSGAIEYVPMGSFIINDAIGMDRNNNKTTIECMDKMVMMGGTYVSSLTYPAAIREVALEIANKAGVAVDSTSFARLSADKIAKPEGYTYREAIGLIAQFEAGFATFNRYGKLEIRTLSDSKFAIPPDNYFSKGLVKNEVFFRLGGISCVTDYSDTVIQSGNSAGNQVVLENRVMTKVLLDKIYQKIQTINYYPFSLNWQGNPVLEAGDWIEVEDLQGNKFKTPNLNYSLSFSGGLTAKSSAETTTQSDVTYGYKSQLQQKIEWIYAQIDAAGGNLIYEGINEPTNPKEGDLWFKVVGPDKQILIFKKKADGTLFWEPQISTADINKVAEEVNKIIDQADKDRTKAEQEINQALTDAKNYTEIKAQEFDNQLLIVNQNVLTATNSANAAVLKADKAIEDVGFMKIDVTTTKQTAIDALNQAQTATNNMSTLSFNVDELTKTVGFKAEKTLVDAVTRKVDQHTLDITANAQAISARLTSAQVDSLVAGKGYVNQAQLTATSSQWNLALTQVSTDLSNLEIGGRNYFTKSTVISSIVANLTTRPRDVTTPNGFYVTGNSTMTGHLRLNKVITSNGWWTVSFDIKGSQSTTVGMDVQICDLGTTRIQTNTTNTYKRVSVTVNVTNYSSDVYNFVDFERISYAYIWVDNIKVEKGNKASDYSDAPEDMTTMEQFTTLDIKVNGIQTTVGNKADQSQVTQLANQWTQTTTLANTHTGQISNLGTQINLRVTSTQVTDAILADKTIKDTRDANETPIWYIENYPRQEVREFKRRTAIGVPGSSTYVQATTKVPWAGGTSGGVPIQIAESNDGVYQRVSNSSGSAWLAWDKVAESGKLISQINISTEGILLQGKRIQLDGDVTMTAAFVTRLDALTLTAVYADIGTLKTKVLTANVIDSTMINANTALITKLFATDANVQLLTAKTAFINAIKAISITADMVTAGTLNAANVNIINLNVSKIVGLNSSFIASQWNSLSASVSIDASGIKTVASDGSATYIQNGVFGARNPAGASLGHIGYRFTDNRPFFNIKSSLGTNFSITAAIGTTANETVMMEIFPGSNELYVRTAQFRHVGNYARFSGEVVIDGAINALTSTMTAQQYRFRYGSWMYDNSTNSQLIIVGGGGLRFYTNGASGSSNSALSIDNYYVYMTRNLSMEGYNITNQSDRRLKTDVNRTGINSLEAIRRWSFVDYTWVSSKKPSGRHLGLIAQDTPELMLYDNKQDIYSINSSKQTMMNSHAIQQLDQKVATIDFVLIATNSIANNAMNKVLQVDSEVQQMKNKISELEKEIKTLKGAA